MGIATSVIDKYQICIDACTKCAQACTECKVACLKEPDVKNRLKCIGILSECACLCKESASFMAMDAKYAKDLCRLCATVCEDCANECGMFKEDHCIKCAKECRSCADECTAMSK